MKTGAKDSNLFKHWRLSTYVGLRIMFSILRMNIVYFFDFPTYILINCNILACVCFPWKLISPFESFRSASQSLSYHLKGWSGITSLPFLSLSIALLIALRFQISPCHFASSNFNIAINPLIPPRLAEKGVLNRSCSLSHLPLENLE